MPIDVTIYGAFICTCGNAMRLFVAADETRVLKCQDSACPNFNVAFTPPTITIHEA